MKVLAQNYRIHPSGLFFGLTVLTFVAMAWVPGVAAQSTEKPLGVLLNDGTQVPTAQPMIRSPIDVNALGSPTASDRATTTTRAQGARPLGTLIDTTQSTGRGGSVLPQGWNRTDVSPARTVVAPSPARAASDVSRPLGTLIQISPQPATSSGPLPSIQRAAPVPSTPTPPQPDNETIPVNFSADQMSYDRDMQLITATGNVEIFYQDRELRANEVTYNQKTDVVTAAGNVSLTDDDGQTVFGERMEITGDLRDGVIYGIGVILADRARVAGSGARRTDARITDIRNAVYSACNLCPDNPNSPPLWQLKAVKIVHDADEKIVSYRDAWLEVFGVPVAYTPYFQHPDPTVKRQSGFLAPSFSNSSDLGFRLDTPYFWAIDEHQDATIAPMITTDGGQGAVVQYRRFFDNGYLEADGSFVADDPDRDWRGYIDLESEFHLNRTWRTGLDIETASDDTFTRRYGFYSEPIMTSRAYLEGFRGRNYQAFNAYVFKDLRDDSEDEPYITPIYDFNFSGTRDRLGGYTSFDFNALNLMRDGGTDTRRVSFRPRWDRPFQGAFGEVYNASVSLAADGYHASEAVLNDGSEYSGFSGRLMPRAALSWRMPMFRPGRTYNQTLEPVASVIVAPNGGNSDKIPNEDSQEIEFDETNLFDEDRYDGLDRVDGGTRINYGLNWVVTDHDEGSASMFIGQSYRLRENAQFAVDSGLDEHFSDMVARIRIQPKRYLDFEYRTQFSPENLKPQRNEVDANLGADSLRVQTSYIFIDQAAGSEFAGREEISGTISSQINRHWSSAFSARHDIEEDDLRSLGLEIVYEDECVKFTTELSRSFFRDRDLEPSDNIMFTLVLKTIGEIATGASLNQ